MAVNINVPSQVRTFANLAAFPATGALKTIYIAEDTNKTYRWTGSVYTEISASAAMTWGAIGGTLSNQTDLQSALDAKVPTTRTLTINGTTQDLSADRTFTISTGITIGSTAIASGTVGRVLFQGTGNVVQQSSSLAYDDTSKLFTLSANQNAATELNVSNTNNSASSQTLIRISSSSGSGLLGRYSASTTPYKTLAANDTFFYSAGTSDMSLLNDFATGRIKFTAGGASTAQMTLFSTGNLAINTTTDAGFRLDVNGTARVSGQTTMSTNVVGNFLSLLVSNTNSGNTSRSTLSFQNDAGDVGSIGAFSSTFVGSGDDAASALRILAPASGGLALRASNASGNIRLYTQSTERMRIKNTGQVRFLPLASAPSGAEAGDVYYNSTDNKHYGYNGTTWNAFY